MRKSHLAVSLAALGPSLVLAAWLAMPASAAQATAVAPAQAAVTGRVTEDGHPVAGAKVTLYAWPRNSVLDALPQGARVPTTVAGSAATNSQGWYSIAVRNPAALRSSANASANGRYVNFQVLATQDGHGADYNFTRVLTSSGNLMVNDDALKPSAVPQRANLALGHASAKNPGCGPSSKIKYLGKHWTVVGLASSRVKKAQIHFEYSSGQSSSLGIGLQAEGTVGYTQDETSSVTENGTAGFPGQTGKHTTTEKTKFKYWKFEVPCVGQEARPTGYAGGTKTGKEGAPIAKNCDSYKAGSTWSKSTTSSSTFSVGVSIKSTIGINLSAQTGWDHEADLAFAFPVRTYLCGKNDDPGGHPGILVAGLWTTK